MCVSSEDSCLVTQRRAHLTNSFPALTAILTCQPFLLGVLKSAPSGFPSLVPLAPWMVPNLLPLASPVWYPWCPGWSQICSLWLPQSGTLDTLYGSKSASPRLQQSGILGALGGPNSAPPGFPSLVSLVPLLTEVPETQRINKP